MIGDRWYLRDGDKLRGLALKVRRFGVEFGAEPTPGDELESFCTPSSRWLTVEALRAHARDLVGTKFISAEDIPGGVRTRQRLGGTLEFPGCDLIQEETL